jgi:hypothetical protein
MSVVLSRLVHEVQEVTLVVGKIGRETADCFDTKLIVNLNFFQGTIN